MKRIVSAVCLVAGLVGIAILGDSWQLRSRVPIGPRAAATSSSVDCSTSTCYYIRDGGTASLTADNNRGDCKGGVNGNWNTSNACDDFPATLVRGAYYLVADGSYAGRTFSTLNSGTTVITIQKATVADHGSSTGWVDTMGDGQATWAVGANPGNFITISTDYWVFDGAIGTGSTSRAGDDPSTYGFFFDQPTEGSDTNILRIDGSHVTFRHTAVRCPGGTDQQMAFAPFGDFTTLSYVYTDNCGGSVWGQGDDLTIEYSYFGFNVYPSGSDHGNQLYGINRLILRWNWISRCDAQCLEPGGGSTTILNNCEVYGNIFVDAISGDGMLKGTSQGALRNCLIYNNTVIRSTTLLKQNNIGSPNTGTGNIVANNLIWQSDGCCDAAGGGAIDAKYNAYFSSGTHGESNEQDVIGNPFAAGSPPTCSAHGTASCAIGDYHLAAATTAGLTLGAPYNVDMFGVTRGADGTWDRGAIEFCTRGC